MDARGPDLLHDRLLAGTRTQDERRASGIERGKCQRHSVLDRRRGRRLGRERPPGLLADRGTPREEGCGVPVGPHAQEQHIEGRDRRPRPLGELAVQKESSDEVKAFAQKMVEDHTRLNDQMKPIADTLGVNAPKHLNKADQAEYEKLSGLSGDAFDQEYITDMVMDHRKDLHEFRREETATSNPDLKQAVGQAEQVISQHLSMIQGIAQQKGIQVPAGHHGKDNGTAPAQ